MLQYKLGDWTLISERISEDYSSVVLQGERSSLSRFSLTAHGESPILQLTSSGSSSSSRWSRPSRYRPSHWPRHSGGREATSRHSSAPQTSTTPTPPLLSPEAPPSTALNMVRNQLRVRGIPLALFGHVPRVSLVLVFHAVST